ncbi:MAG: MerR family transcriptional regulator [Prolixibacteraceae bacterium]|nr:MerR family transcriptional regulator [Prolixibacteraceae bacterium]
MNELIKIKDMTGRYGVSARTLRYYEDIGLIASTRSENYAYRLYDEAAVKRLEQVLILRRLNVSIKDIQRVFSAPGSEVVLEVLGKKVGDIDDEVALLHELKEVILEFIRQIKQADFSNNGDVKLLYEKARDIETQFANADYSGNPSAVNRFLEVTEKLGKKPDIVKKRPAFSLGFVVARNDKEILEVFDFYEKAFGAIKLSQFVPYNTHIHIIMEIHGVPVLLNQDAGYDNNQRHDGGLWAYDDDHDLNRTIEVLSQGAIGVSMYSWEHWPICAMITDKYGVKWLLHNDAK